MQRRKDTPFNITLIGTLLLLTIFSGHSGAHLFSEFSDKLTCHFYHANLFHWFCNAMAIWLMRPSPKDIAYAFFLAVMAISFTLTPTIGFSAVIYSYIGMNILRWKVPMADWATFIVANLITIFIPNIAFGVHLAAFLLGVSVYVVHKLTNRIVLAIEDN